MKAQLLSTACRRALQRPRLWRLSLDWIAQSEGQKLTCESEVVEAMIPGAAGIGAE